MKAYLQMMYCEPIDHPEKNYTNYIFKKKDYTINDIDIEVLYSLVTSMIREELSNANLQSMKISIYTR